MASTLPQVCPGKKHQPTPSQNPPGPHQGTASCPNPPPYPTGRTSKRGPFHELFFHANIARMHRVEAMRAPPQRNNKADAPKPPYSEPPTVMGIHLTTMRLGHPRPARAIHGSSSRRSIIGPPDIHLILVVRRPPSPKDMRFPHPTPVCINPTIQRP